MEYATPMKDVVSYFKFPRYTPPEALTVTGLDNMLMQAWLKRGVVISRDPNPGRGKRRLYAPIDIVKLAILRRTDDLGIALSTGREIAEGASEVLLRDGGMDWNLHIFLRPRKDETLTIMTSGDGLAKFEPSIGDARKMPVSHFTESFEGTGIFNRRKKSRITDPDYSNERPIDPERRETLARQGIHAEPVVVFPLGEIVNGTLAQLRAIDEAGA